MNRNEDTPDINPEDNGDRADGGDSDSGNPPVDPPSAGDGYERGAGTGRNEDGAAPNRYRPTNHPEDAPGGFNPGYGTSNYGGAGDAAYPGYQPYPGGNTGNGYEGFHAYGGYADATSGPYAGQEDGGIVLEPTDGRVNIVRAVRFGFKSVFANPAVWILGTVVVGLSFLVLSLLVGFLLVAINPEAVADTDPWSPANIMLNLVFSVLTWAIMIGVMRGALVEVDGRKARLRDFFHPVNAGQTAILMIIFTIVGLVVGTVIQGQTQNAVMVNELTGEIAVDDSVFGRIALFATIAGLINPLYSYWVYYTSDGRENAVGAATHGFADAVRNYPKLLLYSILSALVIVVAAPLTLFLGFVILLPVSVLISAHLYRQMSGGKVPAEAPTR